jgi:hypothetical protein
LLLCLNLTKSTDSAGSKNLFHRAKGSNPGKCHFERAVGAKIFAKGLYNFTSLPPPRIKNEKENSKYLQKAFHVLPLPAPMHTLIHNNLVCRCREDSTRSCLVSAILQFPLREALPVNGSDPAPIDRRY